MNQASHNKLVSFIWGIADQTIVLDPKSNIWLQNQITKLKEYKTTLIDSVVTGKVRVCSD